MFGVLWLRMLAYLSLTIGVVVNLKCLLMPWIIVQVLWSVFPLNLSHYSDRCLCYANVVVRKMPD